MSLAGAWQWLRDRSGRGRRIAVLACVVMGQSAFSGCDPARVLKTSAVVGDVSLECAGSAFARVTRAEMIALMKRYPDRVVVAEAGYEFWIVVGRSEGRVEVTASWIGGDRLRDELERVERIQRDILSRLASRCGRGEATDFECWTRYGLIRAKTGPTCYLTGAPAGEPSARLGAR